MSIVLANPPIVQSTLNDKADLSYVSLSGAEMVTERDFVASSGRDNITSGGTTTFSIRPPSAGTIISKVILLSGRVTVTASDGNTNVVMNRACLQSFPLNSAIKNITLSVNGQVTTVEPSRLKSIWERLHKSPQFKNKYLSMTPTKRDGDVDYYKDAVGNTARSPFAFSRERAGDEPSRFEWCMARNMSPDGAGHEDGNSVETAKASLERQFTIVEPLLVGDLLLPAGEDGFFNADKIEIQILWEADLPGHMISDPRTATANSEVFKPYAPGTVAAGADLAATVVNVNNAFKQYAGSHVVGSPLNVDSNVTWKVRIDDLKVYMQFVTPSVQLPSEYIGPFHRVARYEQEGLQIASGASGQTTINLIQDSMVPDAIIIAIRRRQSERSPYQSDSFFRIDHVSLMLDNNVGDKSSASTEQLYLMSAQNGYEPTYHEYMHKGQSFVILKMGKDIGRFIPGAKGQFTIQATLRYTNMFATAATPEIDTFLIRAGRVEITPNNCMYYEGYDISEVSAALESPMFIEDFNGDNIKRAGSGIGSFFKKIAKPMAMIAKPLAQVASQAALQSNDPRLKAVGALGKALTGGNRLLA